MSKTVPFQPIQFSISMLFTLSGATNQGQSGPGSNGNVGVLHIHQRSSITRTSPSDCLVSYQDTHWGGESYPSAEEQLVYSIAPADWGWGEIIKEDNEVTYTKLEQKYNLTISWKISEGPVVRNIVPRSIQAPAQDIQFERPTWCRLKDDLHWYL